MLSSALPVLLGGLGVFFLSRIFKLTTAASLISSIAYLNSGNLQMQFYHLPFLYGLILLPWILYSIERFLTRRTASGFVFLTLSFAVLFLCANPQYIFYNIIASMLYFVIRINIFGSFIFREAGQGRAILLSCMFLLAMGIASLIGGIQTLMTFDLLENSLRMGMKGSVNYEGSLSPFLFILHYFPSILIKPVVDWFQDQSFLAATSLFVGVVPSVLATVIFFNRKAVSFHRRQLYALVAIFCLGWFIASAKYNPLYTLIFEQIPMFGLFRFPIRALFISALSISLLSGFGYDFIFGQYSGSYTKKGHFFIIPLLLGLLFCSAYYGLYKNLPDRYLFHVGLYISIVCLIILIIFFVDYRNKKQMNTLRYILIVAVLIAFQIEFILFERQYNSSMGATENQFDSKANASLLLKEHEAVKMLKEDKSLFRIVPYRPFDIIYDRGFGRIFVQKSYDMGFGHISLDNTLRSVLSVQILPMSWGQVFRIPSIGHFDLSYHHHLSPMDATSLIDFAYDVMSKNKDTSVLDMINAKYVLSTARMSHPKLELLAEFQDVFPGYPAGFNSRFFETGPVYVYVNRSAWPRVFLASNIMFVKHEDTLKFLAANLLGKNTALVHDLNLMMELNNSSSDDRLDIEQYKDSSIKLKYRVNKPTLLVVSDHFSKGWYYYINGKKTKAYRVSYCFRGIPLSAGEGIVFMRYLPDSFVIGMIMMGAGIMFLALLAIFIQKNSRVKRILMVSDEKIEESEQMRGEPWRERKGT